MFSLRVLTGFKNDGAWSPLDLPDLALWLRGDSFTFGTTATWADLSGNARDFTATGTDRPTASAAINSQPTVNFASASNQIMQATWPGILRNNQPHTVVLVIKHNGYGTGGLDLQNVLIIRDSTSLAATNNFHVLWVNPLGAFGGSYPEYSTGFRSNAAPAFNPTTAISTASLFITTYAGVGPDTLAAFNATQNAVTQTLNTRPGFSTTVGISCIGGRAGASNVNLNGDIAEIIIMNSVITISDRVQLNNYILSRYGI